LGKAVDVIPFIKEAVVTISYEHPDNVGEESGHIAA